MKRVLIGVGCVLLLAVSWLTLMTAKTEEQKQEELMEQAQSYTDDKIYILAEPLLEEAAAYDTDMTFEVEAALKDVYLQLISEQGYADKYTSLLETQMEREDCPVEIYQEAASYYLENSKVKEALEVLKLGIAHTSDHELVQMYEDNRYQYDMSGDAYAEALDIYDGTAQVENDGLWGLTSAKGSIVIPCQYDKISTYSEDRAIVLQDNEVFAINSAGLRIALLHEDALDFGNLAEGLLPIQLSSGWVRASGNLGTGTASFEELGMYSGGYAAAKLEGKWGVIDSNAQWYIPPEYDDVIRDDLGRCWSQNAVFVRKGSQVLLLVDGKQVGDSYKDAKPFNGGWAAVKKNGLWGFIDTEGTVQIDYQFQDAKSFGEHLAAIEVDGHWGYINLLGDVVIEPIFLNARSFSAGSAPVQTEDGWRFITLLEFEES